MHWVLDGYDNDTKGFMILKAPQLTADGSRVREEYRSLACPICRRIDEMKAFKKGIPEDVVLPKKRTDHLISLDGWDVVSERFKSALSSIKGVKAAFFPIPGHDDYFVVVPKELIRPAVESMRFYKVGKFPKSEREGPFQLGEHPCRGCGRPIYGWRSDWYEAPPGTVFAGVVLEIEGRMSIAIIMNDEVADALKAAKLTGWRKLALKS